MIKDVIIYVGVTALFGMATWLGERLVVWLNTKIKNQKFNTLLTNAVECVVSAVKATNQEFVTDKKAAGEFDTDAQKTALLMAKTKALESLSLELRTFITENIGSVDQWLTTQIHSILYDLKN